MAARIYQRIKNAMQSGRARVGTWTLEFEPAEAKKPDPLTGWAGSGDTNEQVRLTFPSLEAARAYADQYGIAVSVVQQQSPGPVRVSGNLVSGAQQGIVGMEWDKVVSQDLTKEARRYPNVTVDGNTVS